MTKNSTYHSSLKAIAERFGVSAIYVFGSCASEIAGRVRGERPASPNPRADLDAGVQPISGKRLSAREREEGEKLRRMAGYRNRMVHYYQEISNRELYQICSEELGDLEYILSAFLTWIKDHPGSVDQTL